MGDELVVLALGLGLFFLLRWGFKELPKERWQFLGAMPTARKEDGTWKGINFTFYGFINAFSCAFAAALCMVMLKALDIPMGGVVALAGSTLVICIPAAKILARIVEKKSSTFSVGGAGFVGTVTSPWVSWIILKIMGLTQIPLLAVLTAIVVAYAFGEGIGRLSCISFGCCYGKPVSQSSGILKTLFSNNFFIFSGKTKKISYAGHLEGQKVIPIQAVTSMILCGTGLVGLYLFLKGAYWAAFMQTLAVTQGWRFLSEFLRADFRGGRKITVYQWMSLFGIAYGYGISVIFPVYTEYPVHLWQGVAALWNPWILVFLQVLWFCVFLYLGKSSVTQSNMSFFVVKEKI